MSSVNPALVRLSVKKITKSKIRKELQNHYDALRNNMTQLSKLAICSISPSKKEKKHCQRHQPFRLQSVSEGLEFRVFRRLKQ